MEELSTSLQIAHTEETLQTTINSVLSSDLRNTCEHDTPNPKKKRKKNPMKTCRTPNNNPNNNIDTQDQNNNTHNSNSNTHIHNNTTQNPNKNTQSPNNKADDHNSNTESPNKNTYNQNSNTHNIVINQFLENNQHLGDVSSTGKGRARSRGRSKKSTTSNTHNEIFVKTDATVAQSVGFPVDSLTEEEIESGVVSTVGGAEQASYVNIRNQIIGLWRSNVNAWLSKEQVMGSITGKTSLVSSAYYFLSSHGYINFGVAPIIKSMIPHEATRGNVVVIGAGLAGLAAARQLLSFGFKVVIVEGRKRPGGRVYTKKMEVGSTAAAADLGGSVLTGTHGNPLGVLANQLAYPLHKIRDKCPLYRPDGSPVNAGVDSRIEEAFNRLLDKAGQLRQLMGEVAVDISLGTALETFRKVYGVAEADEEEGMLFNWHLANLEYANAGLLSRLSLAFWDQDDPYEMGGDHCFVPGGNGRLVQALTDNLPIFYEKNVNTIRYGSDGVQVLAGGQVFQGDMVLCTVPLGVLKNNSIRFIPELPQRKLDAIKRLGFGLLNKVAMLFPHVFWGAELDTFGHLCTDTARRGEFFLFYSYAAVSGGPLLIALVAGEAAIKFESMPPTDAVTLVLEILKGIYGPRGIDVPDPIQTVCTRWGNDPLSLGSYSHVAVGASGDDYDILAESVGEGRLFFAGEATNRRYPATMHGAFLSGLREAANISNFANIRSMPSKVERSLSKDILSYAALLADLFRHPDLEFGSFSVLFDPQSNDPKSLALLRVMIGGSRRKNNDNAKADQQHSNKLIFQQLQSHLNQQLLYLYTLITQQQALELREVRGGDEARLSYLYEKLGVKLVGRRGLGALGDSLVASIKSARAARRPISAPSPVKFGK